MWMSVLVPTGSICVASNKYMPSVASNAERRGFRVHGRSIFKVIFCCYIMWYQLAMQKDGGVPALMAVNCFSHVMIHCSEILVQWMSAGVYWTLACCSAMKSSTSFEVSLFILCSYGRYPWTLRNEYTLS